MSQAELPASAAAPAAAEDHGPHAVPWRALVAVYLALVVCTALTVGVSRIDLGNFNIWVCLLIAVIKASLVALYFMHLRWDSPFYGIVLISAFFFAALFIGLAMLDSHSYQPIIKPTPMALPQAPPP